MEDFVALSKLLYSTETRNSRCKQCVSFDYDLPIFDKSLPQYAVTGPNTV